MSAADILTKAGQRLDARHIEADRLRTAYEGRSPAAFLSPEAREALRGRLIELPVNIPRQVISTVAERLTVEGMDNPAAWAAWQASRMTSGHGACHTDSLLYGVGYASVWVGPDRRPRIRPESPRQAVVDLDPGTGDTRWGAKRWIGADRYGHALVMEPDRITKLRTATQLPDAEGQIIPTEGWSTVEVLANPLARVPLVGFPNSPSTDRPLGTSEIADVLPLSDAVSKLAQDLMVVSEAHSRPRRWVAGLEVVTDETTGEPINPFSETPARVWQSESAETKFGEFPASSLASFVDGTGVLLRAIAAVTALPPATLGVQTDQPASAEALRASEAGLVARCRAKLSVLGERWSEVATLAAMMATGRDAEPVAISWGDVETRSEIVSADRAAKLHALGVSLPSILEDLGWSPDRVAAEMAHRRRAALDNAALGLDKLLGR